MGHYEDEKRRTACDNVWKFFQKYNLESIKLEPRDGQDDMAFDIAAAIKNKKHYLVEAGVGIGKSYAYIVPLLYYHEQFNNPVAIATSTIALQEQLISDIKKISGFVGHSVDIVCATGQTNYVCLQKAELFLAGKTGLPFDEIQIALKQGIHEIKRLPQVEKNVIDAIKIERFNGKMCKVCKHRFNCGFKRLRANMHTTRGIIVCNQDLLIQHLEKMRKSDGFSDHVLLNSDISLIVVDEAHNLEGKVRDAFTKKLSRSSIQTNLSQICKAIKEEYTRQRFERCKAPVPNILNRLFGILNKQIEEQKQKKTYNAKNSDTFFLNLNDSLTITAFRRLYKKTQELFGIIDVYSGRLSKGTERLSEELDSLGEINDFLFSLLHKKNENLFWLEVSGEKAIRVMQCPKNTRGEIISLFFENKPLGMNTYPLFGSFSQNPKIQSIIFTSATLSNGVAASDKDKYSYFIENTGFPVENNGEEYIKTPIPSPFPYDKHAMIYYAENLPHPTNSRQEFNQKAVNLAIEILKITEGRGLMLFTAKTDLDEVYDILYKENLPFKVLRQSRNSSQEKVLDDFRKDIHSVLLGTGAFWEGIDIPGESLSNVIIFRLPFPVKDTIIEYKHEIAKEKRMSPIMSVDVPEMIIKLKQGIGRLIRNASDKGIVSILDPRLGSTFPRDYQETVWRSLPIKNRTSDIKELKKFFESIINLPKT